MLQHVLAWNELNEKGKENQSEKIQKEQFFVNYRV